MIQEVFLHRKAKDRGFGYNAGDVAAVALCSLSKFYMYLAALSSSSYLANDTHFEIAMKSIIITLYIMATSHGMNDLNFKRWYIHIRLNTNHDQLRSNIKYIQPQAQRSMRRPTWYAAKTIALIPEFRPRKIDILPSRHHATTSNRAKEPPNTNNKPSPQTKQPPLQSLPPPFFFGKTTFFPLTYPS